MKKIDLTFRNLRVQLRKNGSDICEDVFRRYHPATITNRKEICIFCNSSIKITKEHVLPQWLFQKSTKLSFISKVNKQVQSYQRSTVPTCSSCNNSKLAYIENQIIKIFNLLDNNKDYNDDDISNVMRWFEIIDYKLQVLELRRKYIKHRDNEYDPLLANLQSAAVRHFIDFDPFMPHKLLRSSQRRITVKSKINRVNSLVMFIPKNPHFNFFSQPNEYIFISFPMHNLAFFYFLKKEFENYDNAIKEAVYIIQKVSET